MLEVVRKVRVDAKHDIWFTSDTHFNHAGIVRGTSNWEGKRGTRDFDTLEEHDEALIRAINSVVKPDDELYHLGDFSFGSYSNGDNYNNVRKFREKINCKNVHLITGNHDDEIIKHPELQALFSSVTSRLELKVTAQYPSKAQGIKALKQHISLCHYAFRVWNLSHHGSWHLYGHSHGTLDAMTPLIANPNWIGDQYYSKSYRTMDVGVDTHPEFRPYNFWEILNIMHTREIGLEVDHHRKNHTDENI